ncbi:g12401 [Coccomyxa viridis]|uniref:G12401 protein n=1 Tax=Coccomyxa viridis TaxID=1274662 RepID=A0ABP1GBA8_9CHLO
MPARRKRHTRFAKWPNGDILVAGNVTSEADFRGILDDVGDPGLAKTANSKHPMLFEVQPANMPGRYKTNEDFIQLAPCTFSMAKIWKDRKHFGDITVEALNGAQERAHVAILADRLPALRDALLSRPATVVIDKATTGGVLEKFLEFLYTGHYSRRNSLTDEDIQQLFDLAEHHKLTRLSDLLDQGMAQSVRLLSDEMDLETGPFGRPGEAPGAAPGLLELLGTADRLGRKRVVESSGSALRGWGRMPGPCASGEGASQQIPAKEYAEAGGKLTPPEARALAAELAARKGPELTAEERSMCENYAVEAAELKNDMDGYPWWSPSWKLLPNTYECAHDFWGDLFRATFPHTKKLLDKEEVSRCHAGAEAALRHDICEALRADHSISSNHAAQVEEAKIMARAEQGDKTAHFMELLGVAVPVPLMGNI